MSARKVTAWAVVMVALTICSFFGILWWWAIAGLTGRVQVATWWTWVLFAIGSLIVCMYADFLRTEERLASKRDRMTP